MSAPAPIADWNALAARLDVMAEDLMAAAAAGPDGTERTLMELQAVSIRHVARRMRLFPEEPHVPPKR
ncbi:MAG: hypothetical protein ACREIP_09875 [Alphaproteobacteria bacterium]